MTDRTNQAAPDERSPSLAQRVADLLRAGALALVVQEADEALAVSAVEQGAAACAPVRVVSGADDEAIGLVADHAEGQGTLILLDYLSIYGENPIAVRQLREVALQDRPDDQRFSRLILVERPDTTIPPALAGDVEVVRPVLPTVADLREELDAFCEAQGVTINGNGEARYALASAGAGLARHEYARLLARCVVEEGALDAAWLRREKAARVAVKLDGALTFESADSADVGGLAVLKGWLGQRRAAFASAKARAFGLPEPKGLLIAGIPGAGKSLLARTTAREWGLPLLRLDPGALFGSLVGQSESQTRAAIEAAEACAPCVLWIDEIDKGLAGSSGSQGDSGTSARVFGTLLTWLQEKTAPVFVVATANDISGLPAELLRSGRFDERFFVGLPSRSERQDIAAIHIARKNRDLGDDAPQAIGEATEGFTGAEIEECVKAGLYAAFAEDRDLTLDDVLTAAAATNPLSRTQADKVRQYEEAAKTFVRASAPDTTPTPQPRKGRGRRRGPALGK